jgi:hypothetical protein
MPSADEGSVAEAAVVRGDEAMRVNRLAGSYSPRRGRLRLAATAPAWE